MKIICKRCSWEWKKEKGDSHPYLCHKCGYDNKESKFNLEYLKQWQLKHIKLFKDI